jgi:16S rRNA (uracil1498-N3)-methyltransferase
MSVETPKQRLYVPPGDIDGDVVRFGRQQARQLATVLRLAARGRVRVFDGVSACDRVVELSLVSATAASGRIVGQVDQPAEPLTQVVAHPALVTRDKFDQVVQKLVEVGAARIVPVRCARSVVRDLPDAQRRQRWQHIATEAAEQAGRGIVPVVEDAILLAPALTRAAGAGVVLFAHEGEHSLALRTALAGLRSGGPQQVSLFVGPEGGYAPSEANLARDLGVTIVSMGPRILRTETASPVLTAIVLFELEGAAHASRS